MKVFNTLTRKKEEFVPMEPGKVKMYACGPTVYNYIHIGNARPLCLFDVLRRYLEYRGYEVTFVQNFTDIDDKIIKKANEEGTDYRTVSERYIGEYWTDAKGLGVRAASIHPKATETMDEIIRIVQEIVDNGYGYVVDGSVYFRSRKFKGYGKLSHQPLEELDAGNRIELDAGKEDSLDFVLWKAAKPGEPSWESPWGQGRPGWHIECTAMIRKHLGDKGIDIHCGGQDLIFPHHENEIAQGECCGKLGDHPYARYWMHNGFINVDSRKMSKSLGNFFTVRDVAEKYGYEPIKLMMIQAHYRSPINYTAEVIEQCRAGMERLYTCRENLDFALEKAEAGEDPDFTAKVEARKAQFIEAMEDDLNTADGLAALYELARDINSYISVPRGKGPLEAAAKVFDELCGVLGILYDRAKKESLDEEIEGLIAQRQQARKEKNFALADKIRDDLKARGILLEDTAQGVKWHRA